MAYGSLFWSACRSTFRGTPRRAFSVGKEKNLGGRILNEGGSHIFDDVTAIFPLPTDQPLLPVTRQADQLFDCYATYAINVTTMNKEYWRYDTL